MKCGPHGVENTHRNGAWHLSQGVRCLIGQRLLAQELPHRLGGGEEVDQGQERLESPTDRQMMRESGNQEKKHE